MKRGKLKVKLLGRGFARFDAGTHDSFLEAGEFVATIKKGEFYLFGCQVDDSEKGGDIDLYIVPAEKLDNEREKRIEFLVKLMEYLGEQKIDVIISKDKNRLIEQEALKNGVKL